MTALVLVALWLALLGGWWAVGRGLGDGARYRAALPPSDEPTG